MSQTAKIFMNGRSQAVRLPAEFRFEGKEIYIRRDQKTGDVMLSKKPGDWDSFFELLKKLKPGDIPDDFLSPEGRDQGVQDRDPFEGWEE